MEVKYELLYSMIPDFPIATVEFHTGKLIFGTLAGKNIVAMNGRFHYYEGYSMKEITFPVRVMKLLGIQIRKKQVLLWIDFKSSLQPSSFHRRK